MTVRVTKSAKTIKDGILNMKDAMIFDYQGFSQTDFIWETDSNLVAFFYLSTLNLA